MKRITLIIFCFFVFITDVYSNGVAIIDGQNGIYLSLLSSKVQVKIENQVAIIKTTQVFHNQFDTDKQIKYGFPLSENASAINLRYKIDDKWYVASIAPTPQDTTLPGPRGETHPDLKSYLGKTPLYYPIQDTIRSNSILTIELTYVELLKYHFGKVQFSYPNNYILIQSAQLDTQKLDFNLYSSRSIDSIQLLSNHDLISFINDGNNANIQTMVANTVANQDYLIEYSLSLDELGLFSFSTMIPDSLLPDNYGGFLLFVAEPDPGNTTNIMDKVFTFVIDRSGSMSGDKIVQAKEAAKFVVNSLNDGDKFNIVDFATDVSAFKNQHVVFNAQNRDEALDYISNLDANHLTNISGAFDIAVPQFNSANDTTANIIIFFTDGKPTTGIKNTSDLVNHITALINQTETNIFLFVFGIGPNVNKQLLTLLANNNNGLAEFLGNDELEGRITDFYLQIRNPVLLNTQITFSPDVVTEVYPVPLPNLYKGNQMIVVGRYQQSGAVSAKLQGSTFGKTIEYDYPIFLTDTTNNQYQFLTKVWVKLKIEKLLIDYYLLDQSSEEADTLKEQIIKISQSYGVISPFTSFSNPGGSPYSDPSSVSESDKTNSSNLLQQYKLLGNYPNPFNPSTMIKFKVNIHYVDLVRMKIYNTLGHLVKILTLNISGPGIYEFKWDGTSQSGNLLPSGTYFYLIEFNDGILSGKMQLIR